MQLPLGSAHPLLVTPFDDDGQFDRTSMAELIDFVLAGGVQGVIALGTTGEFFTMTPAERLTVMHAVIAHTAGRAPVTVGVGADGTATAVELAREAEAAGAACVMVSPPYFFDLSPEAQIRHFKAVAASTALPVMLYDGAGGIPVSPEVIGQVARACPNVRYAKLAIPEPARIADLVTSVPDVVPLAGDNLTLVESLCRGAQASAIAATCILPREVVDIHNAMNLGRVEHAHKIFAANVASCVLATSIPKHEFIARSKEVLHAMGIITSSRTRYPLGSVSHEEREYLLGVMRELGVL